MSPEPLHHYFERVNTDWRVVVIEFPRPEHPAEPYFAAMAWRPAQVLFLVFARSTQAARYFVVERTQTTDLGQIVEWKKDGTYERHGSLENPSAAVFLEAVSKLTAR